MPPSSHCIFFSTFLIISMFLQTIVQSEFLGTSRYLMTEKNLSTVSDTSTHNSISQAKQVPNPITRRRGACMRFEPVKYAVCLPSIDLTFESDLSGLQVMERARVFNARLCFLVARTLLNLLL